MKHLKQDETGKCLGFTVLLTNTYRLSRETYLCSHELNILSEPLLLMMLKSMPSSCGFRKEIEEREETGRKRQKEKGRERERKQREERQRFSTVLNIIGIN